MTKTQTASCPGCGGRISFRKFVLLNNFSATNCESCNTRIEIANRNKNALLAGISGFISASAIVMGPYLGGKILDSWGTGLITGVVFSTVLILSICRYAYRHSELNSICRS